MNYGAAAAKAPSGRVNKADHDKAARLNRVYRASPEQKRQKMINKSVDHFQKEPLLWSRVGGTVTQQLTDMHRLNLRVVEAMDATLKREASLLSKMAAMEESNEEMHTKLMKLDLQAVLQRKEDLTADLGTAFYNCILDIVDPEGKFRNWAQFVDKKLYAEESAIMDETEEDERDWYRDLEVLQKYRWHNEVIQAVISLGVSVADFAAVVDTKHERNGNRHVSIRSDRRRGVNRSNLKKAKKEYDSLKLEYSSTYDEAFDAIANALK